MSVTAIEGVVAAGNVPTWIIPASEITQDPTEGSWTIPLTALTATTTIKADCHMDMGDLTIDRAATTRERQRACQKVLQTIKTGETIAITLSAVFNTNTPATGGEAGVNDVYEALPEDAEVYIAQAFGWDSSTDPTADTVIDLYKGDVQMRQKTQPTAADEDVKFTATISGSGFFEDVALSGA